MLFRLQENMEKIAEKLLESRERKKQDQGVKIWNLAQELI